MSEGRIDLTELLKAVNALKAEVEALKAGRAELEKPEKPERHEKVTVKTPEIIECPTCGQLTKVETIEKRLGPPVLLRETVKEVEKPVEKVVEKPVEREVVKEVPVRFKFKELLEKAEIKPKSISEETFNVLAKLYETAREEGWAE